MAGVLKHSDFRHHPWGRVIANRRLRQPWSPSAAPRVERIGAGCEASTPGSAAPTGDRGQLRRKRPATLLRWVHCCEVDSFLHTYRARAARSPPMRSTPTRRADPAPRRSSASTRPTCRDRGADARLLQGDARRDRRRQAGPAGRVVRRRAAHRRAGPLGGTPVPAWAGLAGLAAGLLPRWARRLYRLPTPPGADLAATAGLRTLHTAMLAAPPRSSARARTCGPPRAARRTDRRLTQTWSSSGSSSSARPAQAAFGAAAARPSGQCAAYVAPARTAAPAAAGTPRPS